jgi:hypothetical protein
VHEVQRSTSAPPEQVFDVLSGGWLHPVWVVGASRMRAVDDAWPKEGAPGCTTPSGSGLC